MNEFERGKKFAHEALDDIMRGPFSTTALPYHRYCITFLGPGEQSPEETNRTMIKALEHRVVTVENENNTLRRKLNMLEHARLKESDQVERLKEQNRVLKETICNGILEGPRVKKKIAVTCSNHEPMQSSFGSIPGTCRNKRKCKPFWDNGKKPDFCPVIDKEAGE